MNEIIKDSNLKNKINFDNFYDLHEKVNTNINFLSSVYETLDNYDSNISRVFFYLRKISNKYSSNVVEKTQGLINNEVENKESKYDFLKINKEKIQNTSNKTRYLSIKFKKKFGILLENPKVEGKPNLNTLLDSQINWSNSEPYNDFKINKNNNNYTKQHLKIKLNSEIQDSINNTIADDSDSFQNPIHIKDCILGLNSQYPDRVYKTLKNLPEIISNQPYDLDFSIEKLSEILIKFNNNIVEEKYKTIEPDFKIEKCIETILVLLTIFDPIKMTQILCKRFFIEESGLKQKFDILNIIIKACDHINKHDNNLLNLKILNSFDENEKNKNIFTELPDRTSGIEFNKNKYKGRRNNLFPFVEYIIFPLLRHLEKRNIEFLLTIKEMDFLLARFLFLVAKIIFFSENHPKIYQILFESFDLFKAVSKIKDFSILIVDSLNFYVFIVGDFLNSNFLEIYPEFLNNFKYCLEFLKKILEETENEVIKIEIVKNINFYISNLKKIKHSSLLKMDGITNFFI